MENTPNTSDHPAARTAEPRRFLMCPPTHFEVSYSINPWMDLDNPVDYDLAYRQWVALRDLYQQLGHQVDQITPLEGYPDMVFAANGATVIGGKVFEAHFNNRERLAEGPAYAEWFRQQGFEVHESPKINEGEGDILLTGSRILAGYGFRTDPESHKDAGRIFGMEVVSLKLVDPHFYHLDTALSVLAHDEIMYNPAAFSPESQETLRRLYPDAVLADAEDAAVFGLNSVSDGYNVVLSKEATGLAEKLRARGFNPIGVDLSEFLKSGGGAKCCTLVVRS